MQLRCAHSQLKDSEEKPHCGKLRENQGTGNITEVPLPGGIEVNLPHLVNDQPENHPQVSSGG